MKYAAFKTSLLIFSFIRIYAQDDIIQIRILNDSICANKDTALCVEISNNSDDDYYLPIDKASLTSYEFHNKNDSIIASHNSMDQLMLSVRVKDKNDKYYTHVSRFVHPDDIYGESSFFFQQKDEITESANDIIINEYRKLGFNEDKDWLLTFNYFRSNLTYLYAHSKIRLNYLFNLSSFQTKVYDIPLTCIHNGFNVSEKGSYLYIELTLEKDYLRSFIEKFYMLKSS